MSQTANTSGGLDWLNMFTNMMRGMGQAQQAMPAQQGQMPQATVPATTQPSAQPLQQPVVDNVQPELTSGEKMGFTDTGMNIGSMLGTLAAAIDPQGWGGRLGGGVASMTQGEMAARNSRDAQVAQRQHNLQLMQALTQAIGTRNQEVPTEVTNVQKMQ